jgi:hypothetical protein
MHSPLVRVYPELQTHTPDTNWALAWQFTVVLPVVFEVVFEDPPLETQSPFILT